MLAPLIFISRPELPECLLGWFLKSCHTLRAGPCSPQLPWGAWHGSSLPPFTAWVSHPKPQATEPGILWLRSSWVRNMEILWVFYGTVTSFFLQLLLKVKPRVSDWNPLLSSCVKKQSPSSTWDLCWLQSAVGKCMGPEHLGVRRTQCTPCAEMAWLVILHLFSCLRISFREGNSGRSKVPGAVCSTGSLIFLAS